MAAQHFEVVVTTTPTRIQTSNRSGTLQNQPAEEGRTEANVYVMRDQRDEGGLCLPPLGSITTAGYPYVYVRTASGESTVHFEELS